MTDQRTPYQSAAHTYRHAGWAGVLPLPARAKKPVPEGFTGATGADPSAADIQSWIDDGVVIGTIKPGRAPIRRPAGNIALRLPDGIIGIDVDNYGDKQGAATLAEHIYHLGELPPTWRTTARDDGTSGIYLYRVPPGLAWPGIAGPGIEIIQRRHRYAVVWPSIHPDTGATYVWHTYPAALAVQVAEQRDPIPRPGELPELPAAWVEHLTAGVLAEEHGRADLDDTATQIWLEQRHYGDPACRAMVAVLAEQLTDLRAGGARHDAGVKATAALCHLAGEGHYGIALALSGYRIAWEGALASEGPARTEDISGEWRRMLTGAVRIAAAAHPHTPDADPCDDPFAGLIDRSTPWPDTAANHDPRPGPAAASASSSAGQPLATPSPASGPAGAGDAAPSSTGDPTGTLPPLGPSAGSGSDPFGPLPGSTGDPGVTRPTTDRAAPGSTSTLRTPEQGVDGAAKTDITAAPSDLDIVRGQLLRQETERARARRGAHRLLDDEEAAATFRQPVYTRDLAAELEIPDEPTIWRVEQVMPAGANITLTAPFKAGKTTLVNHLTAALADGLPFLDTHKVHRAPVGRVGVWNLEVGAAMYRRWIRDAGIEHPDRVTVLNLRGHRMPLQTRRVEDWAVQWLLEHTITTWIVDPFAAAYKGLSENDNAEVGRFLDALDVIKERAGVAELIMPVHTGRGQADEGQEHARGATRVDDWADVRWILTRDEKDGETTRYFRAIGRDVDVPEARLGYDEQTRRPYVTGPSRYAERRDAYDFDVLQAITRAPGITAAKLRQAVRVARGSASNPAIDKTVVRLAELGRIRIDHDADGRGSTRHYLDDGLAVLVAPAEQDVRNDLAAPTLSTLPGTLP